MKSSVIKLNLIAGAAKMGGELGAILGQHNLNIMQFCKEFNEISKIYELGLPIRVHVKVLEGNSFKIILKGLNSIFLLKNKINNNSILLLDIYRISLIKKKMEILHLYYQFVKI